MSLQSIGANAKTLVPNNLLELSHTKINFLIFKMIIKPYISSALDWSPTLLAYPYFAI